MNVSLIAPQPEIHPGPISRMLSSIWDDGIEVTQNHYLGNSHYDYEVSRIALLDGEIISHWGVWGYDTRVGTTKLKTGGIGAVATKENYRKHGLMTQAGQASLGAMREAGYDLTILHGFTSDYARFGYVRAWTYTTYDVHVDDINVRGQLPSFVAFDLNKNDAADALYNTSHEHFTGTAVRPTYQNILMRQREVYGWTDSRILQGYVYVESLRDEKVLRCMEVVGDTQTALLTLQQLAKTSECERIRFETLPHYHPVLIHLRSKTVRAITDYNKSYGWKDNGWMARIINLHSSLKKLSADLSKRLEHSVYANWQGELLLKGIDEQALLEVHPSKVNLSLTKHKHSAHSVEGGHHLVQLLLGTEEPLEIAMAAQMKLTGDAEKLIQVLFPKQYPALAEWDQF
jgi:predicted acetyltransferase